METFWLAGNGGIVGLCGTKALYLDSLRRSPAGPLRCGSPSYEAPYRPHSRLFESYLVLPCEI